MQEIENDKILIGLFIRYGYREFIGKDGITHGFVVCGFGWNGRWTALNS